MLRRMLRRAAETEGGGRVSCGDGGWGMRWSDGLLGFGGLCVL